MKTVLFAIDGMIPDPKALKYALMLCRRMLVARLSVLHIIQSPDRPQRYLKALKSGALKAIGSFENTMIKATYAEAGVPDPESVLKQAAYDHFQRMLPQKEDPAVEYRCVVTEEASKTVIERFVRRHRNVVLTVFDPHPPASLKTPRKTAAGPAGSQAMPNLAIPLVLVKNGK